MDNLKPTIEKYDDYVIIGSMGHGLEISQESIMDISYSLDGVVALITERIEGDIENFRLLSTETIVRGSTPHITPIILPDNNIGKHWVEYGMEEIIGEVFVPCVCVMYNNGMPNDSTLVISFMEKYKKDRFDFLDIERALNNFHLLAEYWMENSLSPNYLDFFAHEIEKFMGEIREFELWQEPLKQFREIEGYKGISCGEYHVPFIKRIMDYDTPEKPEWNKHLDSQRPYSGKPYTAELAKEIFNHVYKALGIDKKE